MLRGSHKVNRVLDHHFSLGAGSLHVDPAAHSELAWVNGYSLNGLRGRGDTLIFPALTVHKALPNVTEDRLRVSLDNRYQRVGDPIAEHMLNPHLSGMSPLSWADVYASWSSDEFQYYWKEHNIPVLPKITTYLEQAFEEAIQLARSGDERARLHLRRMVLARSCVSPGKTRGECAGGTGPASISYGSPGISIGCWLMSRSGLGEVFADFDSGPPA